MYSYRIKFPIQNASIFYYHSWLIIFKIYAYIKRTWPPRHTIALKTFSPNSRSRWAVQHSRFFLLSRRSMPKGYTFLANNSNNTTTTTTTQHCVLFCELLIVINRLLIVWNSLYKEATTTTARETSPQPWWRFALRLYKGQRK